MGVPQQLIAAIIGERGALHPSDVPNAAPLGIGGSGLASDLDQKRRRHHEGHL